MWCALGDGHHGVRNPIIRNEHLANFINTLNSIKVKIGLYTRVDQLHIVDKINKAQTTTECHFSIQSNIQKDIFLQVFLGVALFNLLFMYSQYTITWMQTKLS